jgi:hypothetical protein
MSKPEPKTERDRQLLGDLEAVTALRKPHTPHNYLFCTVEEFLLRHGTFFTASTTLPPSVKPMRLQQCFENAFRIARRTEAFHYVEGIALDMIPVPHAWLIDANGTVIDPTWTHADAYGRSYCGVELDLERVKHARQNGSLSLLHDWKQKYPALAGLPVIAKNAWFRR